MRVAVRPTGVPIDRPPFDEERWEVTIDGAIFGMSENDVAAIRDACSMALEHRRWVSVT